MVSVRVVLVGLTLVILLPLGGLKLLLADGLKWPTYYFIASYLVLSALATSTKRLDQLILSGQVSPHLRDAGWFQIFFWCQYGILFMIASENIRLGVVLWFATFLLAVTQVLWFVGDLLISPLRVGSRMLSKEYDRENNPGETRFAMDRAGRWSAVKSIDNEGGSDEENSC